MRTTRNVAWAAAGATALALFTAPGASAVTTVQSIADGATAAQVAAAIAGAGVTVSNVSFTGDASAGGLFTETDAAVYGFTGGAVLSSGRVADLPGPNDDPGTTTNFNTAGDADLTALAASTTYDAATLSFDFVPDASSIFISYVFGSEEYNEFVNSQFNDVFGFYVNGQNCAKTAGGDPVTINTINNGANASLYRDNEAGAVNTEMDGYTVPLVCSATVTPNATNTMKLVIADAGDTSLDSWVLLASGGVTTTPKEQCQDGIDNDGDGLVDGADPDCEETPPPGPEICDDGIDNDGDGYVDAYDPDCAPEPEPGSITATKYYDANANGTRDSGEVGIAGWPVTATGGGTTTDLTTGADGSASAELPAGDYTVTEGAVTGWKHVSPDTVDATVVDGEDTAVTFGNLCLGGGGRTRRASGRTRTARASSRRPRPRCRRSSPSTSRMPRARRSTRPPTRSSARGSGRRRPTRRRTCSRLSSRRWRSTCSRVSRRGPTSCTPRLRRVPTPSATRRSRR